jgi:hypothetical protein
METNWLCGLYLGRLAGVVLLALLLVELGPRDSLVWSRVCRGGGASDEPPAAVAADGASVHAIAFQGKIDCGTGAVTAWGGAEDFDVLIVKLDARGEVVWTRQLGGPGLQSAAGVAIDPWGSVLFAGSFEGSIDIDGHLLTAQSDCDVLLLKLDADGGLVWQRGFGLTGQNFGTAVAVAPSGRVLLSTAGSTTIDFGGGLLHASDESHFVAAFGVNGEPLGSAALAASGDGAAGLDRLAARLVH